MSDVVITTVKGAIIEVRLNRPKANAVDLQTSRLLREVVKSFRDNPDLRVAIFTSSGDKFFRPGFDLKAAANGDGEEGPMPDEDIVDADFEDLDGDKR